MNLLLSVLSRPLGSTGINMLGAAGFALMVAGAIFAALAAKFSERKRTFIKLAGLLTVIIGAAVVIAFGKNV